MSAEAVPRHCWPIPAPNPPLSRMGSSVDRRRDHLFPWQSLWTVPAGHGITVRPVLSKRTRLRGSLLAIAGDFRQHVGPGGSRYLWGGCQWGTSTLGGARWGTAVPGGDQRAIASRGGGQMGCVTAKWRQVGRSSDPGDAPGGTGQSPAKKGGTSAYELVPPEKLVAYGSCSKRRRNRSSIRAE